jgi:type I restriction enzyme S subunit
VTPTATVPSHWESGNIRRFAQMKSGHTPSRSVVAYWENTDIPWFTLADVWQLRDGKQIYLGDTANKINELGLANSAAELLPAGTVVLSRTASVGFSGIMPRPMATSQDFWNWVCGPELLPEYLNYQFKSMTAELKSLNMGSTHQTIYQKDAAALQIVVPPLEEQRAIADYLDHETARIDTLIEEQQRLIEMSGERRAAVVDAAMAPSSSWTRTMLKHMLSGVDQGVSPQAEGGLADEPGTWGVLKSGCVNRGVFRPEEHKRLPSDFAFDPAIAVEVGDVIVSRASGSPDLVGSAAIVEHLDYHLILSDKLFRLRPMRLVDARFLVWVLNSGQYRVQVRRAISGAEGLANNLPLSKLRAFEMHHPSLEEQRRIAAHLDEQTAKIDMLIEQTDRFIELARERRSALITAAVTGQIDVLEMA